MGDVYLDFRLPWPAKMATGMLTPEKWWSFEIYLSVTWNAPYFDHTYLGFSSIKSNSFFTKTKEAILYFVIITILEHRRTVYASKFKIYALGCTNCGKVPHIESNFFHGTLD
jgi:hypothetical protein